MNSPAAACERPRLISLGTLAAFVGLAGAGLAVIYPYRTLMEQTLHQRDGDPLTVAYLENLLRAEPDNADLGLALARQRLAGADYAGARSALAPVLVGSRHAAAGWLDWNIAEQEFRAEPVGSERSQALLADLRQRVRKLLQDPALPDAQRIELIGKALAYGERDTAVDVIEALASRGSQAFDASWYAESAGILEDMGEYRGAARLYLLARRHDQRRTQQRTYFIDALRALQAGKLLDEALRMANREIGDLSGDSETLVFLLRLARSANRPELANRYARQLMRLTLLEDLEPARLAADGLDAYPMLVAAAVPAPAPFDDHIYRLGYDAFLASRNLADAYRVAQFVVTQAPRDAAWRERLARTAEWTGRPSEALQQWLALARLSGRDDAWQAVLRLAPGLLDDDALLAGLQYRIQRQPDDRRTLDELVATYERLGRPRAGVAFLRGLAARHRSEALLNALAGLAERGGDDQLLLSTLDSLDRHYGRTPARAMRRAAVLSARNQPEKAFAALEAARSKSAADGDAPFWRMYAAFARSTRNDAALQLALVRLNAQGVAQPAERDDLVELLRSRDPLQAARLAEANWRGAGGLPLLLRAMELYRQAGATAEIGRLAGGLDAGQRSEAEANPEFLRLRATWLRSAGRWSAATHDLQLALARDPADAVTRETLLWLLIDGHQADTLRGLLTEHEADWAGDPGLHDALAAAALMLSRPQAALDRYLLPHAAERQADFLWMMNLADAYEQNQEADRAWRLREALWQRRPGALRTDDASPEELERLRRLARSRLAGAQQPGDDALALLRELVRQDRAPDGQLSPAAKELALGWLTAGDKDPETVRSFLWQQYARTLARPQWAELRTSLAQGDAVGAGRLLERSADSLPRHERVEAALAAGDVRLAASAAFESMDLQRDDAELQGRFTGIAIDQSAWLEAGDVYRHLGALSEQSRGVEASLLPAPGVRIGLTAGSTRSYLKDTTLFSSLPEETPFASAHADWSDRDGSTRAELGWRNGLETSYPVLLERSQRLGAGLALHLGLGHDQPASENVVLRVAGRRDPAELGLTWHFTPDDRLGVEWSYSRYRAYNDLRIGYGQQALGQYNHLFRDLPVPFRLPLEAGVYAGRFSFRDGLDLADTRASEIKQRLFAGNVEDAGALRPQGFSLYGVRLATQTPAPGEYLRGLVPYAAIGWSHNSVVGPGYELAVGLSGSVFGKDRFSLTARQDKGGDGLFERTSEVSAFYRLFF